jgi:hypothetical protein
MRAPPSGPTEPARALPGALSPLTAGLVTGAVRPGTVVGAHRFGVYVAVAGSVLPVLAADAVALPTAVRLAVRSGALDHDIRAGDLVAVGEGAVVLPGLEVRAVRSWRPPRVRVRRDAVASVRPVVDCLRAATADAPSWLSRGVAAVVRAADPVAAVPQLLGRGRGLTPSGDDALAGALLVLHALADPRTDRLAGAVRSRLRSTTAVSAALLGSAADGWAAPEVVALVDAAVSGDADAVRPTLGPVLGIGHTSGRDLVCGVAAALEAGSSGGIAA